MNVAIEPALARTLRNASEGINLIDENGIVVGRFEPDPDRLEYEAVMRNSDPNRPTFTTAEVLEQLKQAGIE